MLSRRVVAAVGIRRSIRIFDCGSNPLEQISESKEMPTQPTLTGNRRGGATQATQKNAK